MPSAHARALLRSLAFLALTLALVPAYVACFGLGQRAQHAVARLWCRVTCVILGVTLRVEGRPFQACPTLYVANHVSYIDILALGTVVDARFIAKVEVASWPLFGQLALLTRTFFVRRRPRLALVQRKALAAQLRTGRSFVLFAEGTSSDGLGVLPFKTSLLSVAEPWVLDRPVAVQPVTLCYRSHPDGTPADRGNASLYAWYGDGALLPHLWRVLGAPGVVVAIHLGPATLSWATASRKRLGAELHRMIGQRLELLHLDREEPVAVDLAAPQHAR